MSEPIPQDCALRYELIPVTRLTGDLYVYDGSREQNVGNVIEFSVKPEGEKMPVFAGAEGCGAPREVTYISGVTGRIVCDYVTAMNLSLLSGGRPSEPSPDGDRRWGIGYALEHPAFQVRFEHLLPWGQFLNIVLRRVVFGALGEIAFRAGEAFQYEFEMTGYPAREFDEFEYGYRELTITA